MKCTSCQKNVADDAAVCPFCDAVLDPSLLDMAPPEEDDDEDEQRQRPSAADRGHDMINGSSIHTLHLSDVSLDPRYRGGIVVTGLSASPA